MPAPRTARRPGSRAAVALALFAGIGAAGLGAALLTVMLGALGSGSGCSDGFTASAIALGGSGSGELVGATEYGGPGDPSSGVTGARGDNLIAHPDTYAELGGLTWQTATAMGGLSYMTPLRITFSGHSAIAYKRDFGLGGAPVGGLRREIDLWWQLAGRLGIPYESGLWSGAVRITRPPAGGAGNLLGAVSADPASAAAPAPAQDCTANGVGGVALVAGPRATLLPGGAAAAPAGAPAAIRSMIAAGNQIVDKPYVYGGGHGLPLSEIAPGYDCSSSVEHILYGAGLLPVGYGAASSALESFGLPGPGRWVTIYASADHVFMYVAGLRWDTHDAAGPGDGSGGIGWHPLVRSAAGFVARHPVGL